MKTLIVLSGGGFAQLENAVGCLVALEKQGLNLNDNESITWKATSAGAIIATLISSGHTAKAISDIFKVTPTKSLVRKRWFWFIRFMFGISVYDRRGTQNFAKNLMGDKVCDNVTCILTKMTDQSRCEFNGSYESTMGSSAIEGIFSPWKISGVKYIDGGYTDNVPFDPYDIKNFDKVYVIMYPKNPSEMKCRKTYIGRLLQGLTTKLNQELNETELLFGDVTRYPSVRVLRPPPIESNLLGWSKDFSVMNNAEKYTSEVK